MRSQILRTAVPVALLALVTSGSVAQEGRSSTSTRNEDVIIIKPKKDADTKLTIEIKGDDVKINGKPLSEYKNDDIDITHRKEIWRSNTDAQINAAQMQADQALAQLDAARSMDPRFHGGPKVYGYNDANQNAFGSTNSNKAFLGVGTEKNEDGIGVVITAVSGKSAAEKAGLREGDVLTRINETPINSPAELTKAVGALKPDAKVSITYKRDKKEQKATAVLTKRITTTAFNMAAPKYQLLNDLELNGNNNFNFSFSGKPRLGVKAQETEDGNGLKVLDVDDESPAEQAGIKEGDIITSFDGTAVNNIDKLRELSQPALNKIKFKINILRDGKAQEIEVKIPKNLKTTNL